MGIFDGMGDMGGRVQLPWLRNGGGNTTAAGGYLLTIERLEAFENKDGQGRVTAEFRVADVTSSQPNSHAEGTLVKEMWCLDRTLKGELTNRGRSDMFRMRNFFNAIFSQVDMPVTNENIAGLAAQACETARDGGAPVGIQVLCEVFDEASRSTDPKFKDRTYSTTRFSAPPKS